MLIRDNYQNFKTYQLPKAQLIVADIPYNVGNNAYGSNPSWYVDGDRKNGETAGNNSILGQTTLNAEFIYALKSELKKEPKEKNQAPLCG